MADLFAVHQNRHITTSSVAAINKELLARLASKIKTDKLLFMRRSFPIFSGFTIQNAENNSISIENLLFWAIIQRYGVWGKRKSLPVDIDYGMAQLFHE
jgi:hypothetical protein